MTLSLWIAAYVVVMLVGSVLLGELLAFGRERIEDEAEEHA